MQNHSLNPHWFFFFFLSLHITCLIKCPTELLLSFFVLLTCFLSHCVFFFFFWVGFVTILSNVCLCNNHVQMDSMDSEVETLEQRLTSMLGQLQVECGILERMVYKNKNQHRRCLYFQYLLKVHNSLLSF